MKAENYWGLSMELKVYNWYENNGCKIRNDRINCSQNKFNIMMNATKVPQQ